MGGVVSSRAGRLVLRSSGRVRTFFTVLIAQPRTTFCVLQAASPLRRFFERDRLLPCDNVLVIRVKEFVDGAE